MQIAFTLLYLAFRYTLPDNTDMEQLKDYEFKSFAVIGVVAIIRMIRVDSWMGFFIFLLKVTHLAMSAIMISYNIYWGISFGLAAVCIHFGIDPPFFEIESRVATLPEHLLKPYIQTCKECFILFYTTWEGRCISIMPVYGKLAEVFTTQDRLFGKFDIGKNTEFEKEFQISATNGTLRQIPTIIHFKNGKEVKRLNPAILQDKSFNLPTIAKYFHITKK